MKYYTVLEIPILQIYSSLIDIPKGSTVELVPLRRNPKKDWKQVASLPVLAGGEWKGFLMM